MSEYVRKKFRKPRKPMSEEQRVAAVERLAKAREARGHDGSKSVHPDLLEVSEDSPLYWKNVRSWIKDLTVELKAKKHLRTSKDSKERQEYQILDVYIANLKRYLDTGVYHDNRYGARREGKIQTVVTTMAYHPNGRPKRTIGFYYPDCGVYTQEMKEYDDGVYGSESKTRRRTTVHEQEEVLQDGGEGSSTFWDDLS